MHRFKMSSLFPLLTQAAFVAALAAAPAPIAQQFADFTLPDSAGKTFQLSENLKSGPVVLVVLRGWPGYQCPFCARQFGEFLSRAEDFRAAGAQVVFVYPAPVREIAAKLREFEGNRAMPEGFRVLADAGMQWAETQGLRWNAAGETTYPATFVLDRRGEVRFQMISKTHGGRASAAQVLEIVKSIRRE